MKRISLIALVLYLATGFALAQQTDIAGVVVEQQSKRPIANLDVRLVPPRTMRQPTRVTQTDAQGRFRFVAPPGTYLLEVSASLNLLYRAEINTSQKGPIMIRLQRR